MLVLLWIVFSMLAVIALAGFVIFLNGLTLDDGGIQIAGTILCVLFGTFSLIIGINNVQRHSIDVEIRESQITEVNTERVRENNPSRV